MMDGGSNSNHATLSRRADPELQKQKQVDKINDEKLDSLEKEIFSQQNIQFKDNETKEVRAGSLDKLVEHLTWHSRPDLTFNNTFLLTYRSFTTPHELLSHIMERFELPVPQAIADSEEKVKLFNEKIGLPTQLRVCNILKQWIDKHYHDFEEDEKLLATLREFVDNKITKKNEKFAKSIKKLMDAKSKEEKKPTEEEKKLSNKLLNILREADLLNYSELEIAEQLTDMEFRLYSSIQPKELLNQAWNNYKKNTEESPVAKSNVNLMIDSFNDVSRWVATEVVTGADEKKRAATIKYFITLGQYCRKLQNFNALMAIVAGLNGSAIHRLKKSWDLVHPKKRAAFEELQATMSQQNNYATLRNLLHSVDPPCIPYLGMYLTDLTFIEDGNPNVVEGLINFEKRRKISFVVREIQQYQQTIFSITSNIEKQQFINARKQTQLSEDELYEKSLKAEPRK